jgi:hypothetical protein
MKSLNLKEMEVVEGGAGCGKAGGAMGVIGGVLSVALLVSPAGAVATTVGWGLAAAFGLSFSVAGIGCGIADLVS